MVVMVFPVAMMAPVGGVSIHHTRLGHYYRRFCHDDRCALHDHRLRDHHWSRLHNHRGGGDHDWHAHPNRDLDPACLCRERQGKTGHPD
jgi:hypothetical protein